MTTQATIHPFEKSGLGKAPFRYIGMVAQDIQYGQRVVGSIGGIEITTNPGGTCDHCGHAILNMFRVQSSDGKTFKVGCDCIRKVDPKLSIAISSDMKSYRDARDVARIERAKTHLDDLALTSQPHPNAYRASQGETLSDYCLWMFSNAGSTGKITVCRIIEKEISVVDSE